jgi:hypothetical protein
METGEKRGDLGMRVLLCMFESGVSFTLYTTVKYYTVDPHKPVLNTFLILFRRSRIHPSKRLYAIYM